tara:strand:- start:63 stop:1130 length:1068 start_codon:yes stop_codon:yes gene_type:complete
MAYKPLSDVIKKYTSGKFNYITKNDEKPYTGPYLETSDGELFAGHNNTKLGPRLLRIPLPPNNQTLVKKFSNQRVSRVFNILRPDIQNELSKNIPIASFKPLPSESDYRKGFFIRYFSKRINGNSFIEIDKDTFDSILNKEGKYDSNLYEVGRIKWHLIGDDIHRLNASSVKRHSKLITLFPVLNEYARPSKETKENLTTVGGELYYKNGVEYVGKYHIHPGKGPMVGATHSSTPHESLYYMKELPKLSTGKSYEDFLKDYDKVDCYKCISLNKNNQISILKGSRVLGCPEGSYSLYTEAVDACSAKEVTPIKEERTNTYDVSETTTPPLNNQTPSTPSTPSGGGGTSSGGGGGY